MVVGFLLISMLPPLVQCASLIIHRLLIATPDYGRLFFCRVINPILGVMLKCWMNG